MATVAVDNMNSQLVEYQDVFLVNVARLILHAKGLGYMVAGGELYRSNQEAQRLAALGLGTMLSLHIERLAFDLILRRDVDGDGDADWLRMSHEYSQLGAFWKSLDYRNRWGGDFLPPRVDGNHFSMSYLGRK